METRNVKITLEKAKEWYKSNDDSLKEVALQAFTKEELEPFDFTTIKTFEDACKFLGFTTLDICILVDRIATDSIAAVASFKLNIIRRALNKDQNIDLLNGTIWYPYTPFIAEDNTYQKDNNEKEVKAFVYKNKIYKIIGGFAGFGLHDGLGSFDSCNGVGHAYAAIGFLGCATKEIAEHFGKYFAKEIFDAKYGDLINYKWL